MARGLKQSTLAVQLEVHELTVSRWECGQSWPAPRQQLRLCEVLKVSPEELGLSGSPSLEALSLPARSESPRLHSSSDLVAASTREASAFIAVAGDSQLEPILIEQAYSDSERLAIDYLHTPPATILGEASALRARILRTLEQHRKPNDARELYLVSGLLSGIITYACLDLGHPEEAATQARAGAICADFTGHNGLRAWLFGTRSLIARFQGRYRDALDLARQGLEYAGDGTSGVRLRCGEAQSLANLGDPDGTHHALNLARHARDAVKSPDVSKGIFAFPEAKQSYYSGSALIWLAGEREARSAEQDSLESIRLFQSGPQEDRSLADELLAHIYLATARVHLGELEGAVEALEPVLRIPVKERISWQKKRLARIGDLLCAGRLRGSQTARAVRCEIAAFCGLHAPRRP